MRSRLLGGGRALRSGARSLLAPCLCVLSLGLSTLACSDDATPDQPPPSCARSVGPIADTRCLADEDCPCGSGCNLGRCVAECAGQGDCEAGTACDRFGRCTAAGARPETLASSGRVRLSRSSVLFTDGGERPELVVETFGATDRIRALSPEGVLVSCNGSADAAADFSRECERVVSSGGDRVTLILWRAEPESNEQLGGEFLVYGGGHLASAAIGSLASPESRAPLATAAYSGQLEALSSEGETIGASILVTASVVDDGTKRRIRVVDPGELLFRGTLAVELSDDGDGEFTALAGDVERVLSGADTDSEWRAELGSSVEASVKSVAADAVVLNLAMEPLGLVPSEDLAQLPSLDYRLILSRRGPLAGEQPEAAARVLTENPRTRALSEAEVDHERASLLPCPADMASVECVERLLCFDPDGEAALDETPGLTDELAADAAMADVLCSGDRATSAFPVFTSELTAPELLGACLSELDAFHSGRASVVDAARCVAAPRVTGALRVALENGNETSFSLAQHLFKQWVELQSFVLNQSRDVERLRAVLGDDAEDVLPSFEYSLEDSLRLAGASFDLLLHPRLATSFLAAPASVLGAPDYRKHWVSEPRPVPSQVEPLAVDLLDAAAAYATTATAYLAANCGVEAARALASEASRRSYVLADYARLLQALAANAGDGAARWRERSAAARTQLGVALSGLQQALGACRSGVNLLGIDDADLPLYFGDAATANERFSAVSDYLLGAELDTGSAWVPSAVNAARSALEDTRAALEQAAVRRIAEERDEKEMERREQAILRRYGEQVLSLCGDLGGLPSEAVLASSLEPNSCFVAPGCVLDERQFTERLSTGSMAYDLCVMGKLREHAGPVAGFGDSRLDEAADRLSALTRRTPQDPNLLDRAIDWSLDALAVGREVHDAFNRSVPTDDVVADLLGAPLDGAPQSELGAYENMEPAKVEEILGACQALKGGIDARLRPRTLPAACEDTSACPVGFFCLQSECQPEARDPLAAAECYSGAIGEQVLTLKALATDVDLAKAELAELTERYDIAMRSCNLEKLGNERIEVENAAHDQRMEKLRDAKHRADRVAGVFGTLSGSFSAGLGAAAAGPAGIAAAVGLSLVGGFAQQGSAEIEAEMEQVEDDHQAALDRIGRATELGICFNDATQHLVGGRSAALRITRATEELAVGVLGLRNSKRKVSSLLRDGRAELEEERSRSVAPLANYLWIDEKLDRFEREFRVAQRATYLAVRAVEYEFQACIAERPDVLTATRPDQLDAVVDALLAARGSRGIGGRRPSDGVVVLSLKNDILALADRSDPGAERHAFSRDERARLLGAPRNAHFDADGTYLGQRIEFALSPEVVEKSGSVLLSGNSCAERLWAVTASVLGSESLNADTSFVELALEQQNSFYSTLCAGACEAAGSEGRQVASIRPSHNLFLDPIGGALRGVGPDAQGETRTYSSARVRAFVGVSRGDLEHDEYADGGSEELAGRGLWGGYALLIPAAVIARDEHAGLVLSRVEDILLRLEFVSVAAR